MTWKWTRKFRLDYAYLFRQAVEESFGHVTIVTCRSLDGTLDVLDTDHFANGFQTAMSLDAMTCESEFIPNIFQRHCIFFTNFGNDFGSNFVFTVADDTFVETRGSLIIAIPEEWKSRFRNNYTSHSSVFVILLVPQIYKQRTVFHEMIELTAMFFAGENSCFVLFLIETVIDWKWEAILQ